MATAQKVKTVKVNAKWWMSLDEHSQGAFRRWMHEVQYCDLKAAINQLNRQFGKGNWVPYGTKIASILRDGQIWQFVSWHGKYVPVVKAP